MKYFTIDAENNITAYASQNAASSAPAGVETFATASALEGILAKRPGATAVEIWNLTG